MLVNWMGPFHEGREWLQRDEAQRSIGMAMQTLMLAAQGLGYQSCPMIGFDIEEVAKLINLPEDHVMGPMVAIGKGTKDAWPKPGQLPTAADMPKNLFTALDGGGSGCPTRSSPIIRWKTHSLQCRTPLGARVGPTGIANLEILVINWAHSMHLYYASSQQRNVCNKEI